MITAQPIKMARSGNPIQGRDVFSRFSTPGRSRPTMVT